MKLYKIAILAFLSTTVYGATNEFRPFHDSALPKLPGILLTIALNTNMVGAGSSVDLVLTVTNASTNVCYLPVYQSPPFLGAPRFDVELVDKFGKARNLVGEGGGVNLGLRPFDLQPGLARVFRVLIKIPADSKDADYLIMARDIIHVYGKQGSIEPFEAISNTLRVLFTCLAVHLLITERRPLGAEFICAGLGPLGTLVKQYETFKCPAFVFILLALAAAAAAEAPLGGMREISGLTNHL